MTGPYGNAAETYWQAGWRGILPLPLKAKKNPPSGYTGEAGSDPSYADIYTWLQEPTFARGNIALRLPRNVIGLDVDNYGGKRGADALATCEASWGQLAPTWRSTSRDDGVSGIRFYRVPEGLAWPGELGPSTEIIQFRHRYAVVCPSVHPEGRTYRWLNPAGVVSTSIPDPDELPALPDAWVEGLTRGVLSTHTARNNHTTDETAAWLITLTGAMDRPCPRMRKAIDQLPTELLGSAHNGARDGSLRAIRLASEGHAGLITALAEMQRLFLAEATSPNRGLLKKARRTDTEARREWNDLVTSAANLVTANPTGAVTCDCYGQLTAGLLTPPRAATDGSSALAPEIAPAPAPAPHEQETQPAEAPSRLKDGATFILDTPEGVPTVWGDGDEVLWAQGEALMLVGPPGVGKTTLCGQVVRARLGLSTSVLGMDVAPSTKRVLYLAMDRPAQIARSLRRTFDAADRAVLADKLRVWEGPPPGDVARNTDILVALASLAEADTIIIDSLKDAAIGLTEDEVAAGYNRARQTALAAGIEVLELHHLVKRGPNGAKPNTLADVYGSAWLTAGAGSVVLLWGAAGDPLVELSHLKQPAAEFGPLRLVHDHTVGQTTVFHATDLLMLTAAAGAAGLTAKAAAVAMFEDPKPSKNDIQKARRKLDRLTTDGHLERREDGGNDFAGESSVTWHTASAPSTHQHAGGSSHAQRPAREGARPSTHPLDARTSTHQHAPARGEVKPQVRPSTHTSTPSTHPAAAIPSTLAPPFTRGRVGGPASADDENKNKNTETVAGCRTCGTVANTPSDLNAVGECIGCEWSR